mmetsp:Transcript_324/g.757  ORF Transcript_324/g.757 Transcript_324/m.757 type:complete len:246 (+) Transcript_324:85-822(+)
MVCSLASRPPRPRAPPIGSLGPPPPTWRLLNLDVSALDELMIFMMPARRAAAPKPKAMVGSGLRDAPGLVALTVTVVTGVVLAGTTLWAATTGVVGLAAAANASSMFWILIPRTWRESGPQNPVVGRLLSFCHLLVASLVTGPNHPVACPDCRYPVWMRASCSSLTSPPLMPSYRSRPEEMDWAAPLLRAETSRRPARPAGLLLRIVAGPFGRDRGRKLLDPRGGARADACAAWAGPGGLQHQRL